MAKDISFLREVGDQVIFVGNYMEVYLPKFYFEKGIAITKGVEIETLGIFNFKVFSSEEKKENSPVRTYSFPSIISTKPSSSYNANIPKLVEEADESEFTVLKYYKGDIFITNVNTTQKSDNVQMFIDLLNAGKLPKTIPYDKILELEIINTSFNGVNLKVPGTVMELIISEIYRDKQDLTKPFRLRAGSGQKVSMYDYKAINMKSIPTFNSTFTAVTFEDIDYNLTASVNKTRQGKKELVSPIEKTIKY